MAVFTRAIAVLEEGKPLSQGGNGQDRRDAHGFPGGKGGQQQHGLPDSSLRTRVFRDGAQRFLESKMRGVHVIVTRDGHRAEIRSRSRVYLQWGDGEVRTGSCGQLVASALG